MQKDKEFDFILLLFRLQQSRKDHEQAIYQADQ